jgi:hypothetical protein
MLWIILIGIFMLSFFIVLAMTRAGSLADQRDQKLYGNHIKTEEKTRRAA